MNKIMVLILILLSLCLLMIIGCGGPEDADADVTPGAEADVPSFFTPEYDFCFGYDIFPLLSDISEVNTVFQDGNTDFDVYPSDTIDTGGTFPTIEALSDFVDDHAEQEDGILTHKAYLVGAVTGPPYDSSREYLGLSMNAGQENYVAAFIFVQAITNKANGGDFYYDFNTLRRAVVVHELGHARADLEHVCIDPLMVNYDSESHNNKRCAMVNDYPVPKCMESEDDYNSPLENLPFFCGNCADSLKKVKW